MVKRKAYLVFLFIYIYIIPFYDTIFIQKTKVVLLLPIALFVIFKDRLIFKGVEKNNVNKCLILFFITAVCSSFFASDSDLATAQLISYLLLFVFYLSVINISSSHSSIKMIYRALLFSLLISIFLGYFQFLGLKEFYIYNEESLNTNTILDVNSFDSLRAWGPFGNSLTYSMFLSVIGILIGVDFMSKNRFWYSTFSVIIFCLTTIALIISGGRTACVTFILSYIIALFYIKKKYRTTIFVVLIFLVAVALFNKERVIELDFYARFLNSGNDFKVGRWDNWINGIEIFLKNPFLGAGAGNLNTELQRITSTIVIPERVRKFPFGHVESTYVTVLSTYGLIGASIFIKLIFSAVKSIVVLRIQYIDGVERQVSNSLLFGWLVILLNMITNPAVITDIRISLIFILLLALPSIITKVSRSHWSSSLKGLSNASIKN